MDNVMQKTSNKEQHMTMPAGWEYFLIQGIITLFNAFLYTGALMAASSEVMPSQGALSQAALSQAALSQAALSQAALSQAGSPEAEHWHDLSSLSIIPFSKAVPSL